MRYSWLAVVVLIVAPAFAQEDSAQPSPPPAATDAPAPEEDAVPDIRIVEKARAQHQEYRLNGRLYMIRVVPKHGKPYYLVDPSGDGLFRRHNGPLEDIAVPQWVLFRF